MDPLFHAFDRLIRGQSLSAFVHNGQGPRGTRACWRLQTPAATEPVNRLVVSPPMPTAVASRARVPPARDRGRKRGTDLGENVSVLFGRGPRTSERRAPVTAA